MSTSSPQLSTDLQPLLFNNLGSLPVVTDFSAGHLSSDGGMLFLRQIDEGLGLSRSLAGCFSDRRNPLLIEHSVRELVAQRLLGLAAGYEDLNDHNLLRLDPLFAVAVGKEDPLGTGRALPDQGKALASASTLNRLELGNNKNTRCHKISANHEAIEDTLLRKGVSCLSKHSKEVVVDLDASDNPLHGQQEGRFFHGFYGCYCYLPLFAFVGSIPLWAELRTSDGDASRGAVDALKKIVAAVRKRCPKAQIIVRADSGFCREEIMAWCEAQQPKIYYCLGLARNSRLRDLLEDKFARVRELAILCGGVARGFTEFQYQTQKSWTLSRRVIGKAEVLGDKDNPRFIVTNLAAEGFDYDQQSPDRFCAKKCYEDFYCARGNMENQIKQQYLDLDADRTSTHWMASNQLRLWLSAFALLLFQRLRTLALQGTELANATAGTIRQRLLKIGAMVTVSTRRVYIRLASSFPLQNLFAQAHQALREWVPEED
jgi:Transposase DDE domain group 1